MEWSRALRACDHDDSNSDTATSQTSPDDHTDDQVLISWSIILRALEGVAVASKAAVADTTHIVETIGSVTSTRHGFPAEQSSFNSVEPAHSLREWYTLVASTPLEAYYQHYTNIALGLAFLCHSGRRNVRTQTIDLEFVWSLVRGALSSTLIPFTVSRSAQGFLTVPLWSTVTDGNIQELFRLHVWLPDSHRSVGDRSIHAHQCFGHSWILAGEGRDHTYDTKPTTDRSDATHAEYSLSWVSSSGAESGTKYQTHQKSSTVVNTGKLVCVTLKESHLHSRNMEYSIPAGICHASDVASNILHSTLFLFDASRGFCPAAPVLGPIDGNPNTQKRDAAGVTALALVKSVEAVREWESLCQQGQRHRQKAEREEALQTYRAALHLCNSSSHLPQSTYYREATLGAIASILTTSSLS